MGVQKIYEEKASGARFDRPVLWECLGSLRSGDQFVFYKLDRVARSLSDLLKILDRVERAGASIRSLTEPIDTSSAHRAGPPQELAARLRELSSFYQVEHCRVVASTITPARVREA